MAQPQFKIDGDYLVDGADSFGGNQGTRLPLSRINDLVQWVRANRLAVNQALEVKLAENGRHLYQVAANLRGQLGETEQRIQDNQERQRLLQEEG